VGASWYQRDRQRFLDLMERSTAVHRQLALRWEALSREYRTSAPEQTGADAWAKTWSDRDQP
jgi:galactofuranosylgalactofuranosylrhamnosyl-N-acetylglucosaminyl-diphospho-decaprenol beta-1,5/1,6-galactofuranosyltransferase